MSWLPKSSVVVPVDFSDESLAAVSVALEMVDSAANVHVIHVLPALSAMDPGVVWDTVDDASRQDHAEDALRAKLSGGQKEVDVAIAIGDPGHEITNYASEVNAELLVLPSHGRTGMKRLLIGSVAERVMRLAHCPVLVLKK